VISLLRDEKLRHRLGLHAAVKIRQQGDRDIWMQRMMDIYHEIAR
jgi:hypothetical protein